MTKPTGSTPRRVTLAPVFWPKRGTSVMTMISPEASGRPSAPRAMAGSCFTSVPEARSRKLASSPLEPPRVTTTRSSRPVPLSVFSRPADIDSSATITPTTPAMPITITSDAPRRWGTLRRFIITISRTCV